MGINKLVDVLVANLAVYEDKTKKTILELLISGMLAGAFIAIGASSSSAAVYGISNTGLAKTLAGAIFPVGLIFVVMIGGELFTGDCLMSLDAMNKRVKISQIIRVLVLVFVFNMLGALLIVCLVNRSGQLDYGNRALAASAIKTAYNKLNLGFGKALCSGIMCNILVCLAVLLAGTAKDATGKIFAIFFPIWAFVIGGYEHCVANMYYIPAGLLAKTSDAYYQAAIDAGMTASQLDSMTVGSFFIDNLLPVTIGNIIGGMLFVAFPLYVVHKKALMNK